jgi:hypothetical protein
VSTVDVPVVEFTAAAVVKGRSMLVYDFAHPSRVFSKMHPIFFGAAFFVTVLVISGLWSGPAKAADTLPLTQLDAKAEGKISSAEISRAGEMTSAVSISTSESVVSKDSLLPSKSEAASDKTVLRDAHRASLFLGAAVTDRIELSLGLHGSFEHVKPENRDVLFSQKQASTDSSTDWRDSTKESGFVGASLLAKIQLLKWQSMKVAIAPFLESGAGEQATYSLTRSVSPKAGWMGLMTYGDHGVAQLNINAGYRYREPEELGEITLRNELFYGASLKAYLSRNFGIFLAGQGRQLLVARNTERDADSDKLLYKAQESGEVTAGLSANVGDADLSIYGGTSLKTESGFGFGKSVAGLSVTYALGNFKGRSADNSYAKEVESSENEKAAAKKQKASLVQDGGTLGDKATATGAAGGESDQYTEMIGADIDPLEAIQGDGIDDFTEAQKNADINAKAQQGPSDDEKVEAELNELNAAEEKAEVERAKQDKLESEARREKAAKRSQANEKLMEEWSKEAQQDAEGMPTITRDEMEWNGLE